MRVPRGPTVNDLIRQAGLKPPSGPSTLPLSMRASDTERAKAAAQLRKRCPYLFSKTGPTKSIGR